MLVDEETGCEEELDDDVVSLKLVDVKVEVRVERLELLEWAELVEYVKVRTSVTCAVLTVVSGLRNVRRQQSQEQLRRLLTTLLRREGSLWLMWPQSLEHLR